MITRSEQRFIEHWREQRSGTKANYYLIFTLGWSVVSFLVLFFLTKLLTNLWDSGGKMFIVILIILALIIGFLSTHFTYYFNEKKFNRIIEKEKKSLN
ncbi:MAG TPA: hypothetical protein VG847_15460 [Chitinophagaceae bacterium]|nr:hypothetical protein [Chitinophagaceae bacterium]